MPTLTAVDGGQVSISVGALEVNDAEATMFGVWSGGLGRHEIAVGNLRFGEETGAREGITLTEDYGLRNGQSVRVGHGSATDPITQLTTTTVLGVWLGSQHSVRLFVQGVATASELTSQVLAVFDGLEFTETVTGVVIQSSDPASLELERGGPRAPDIVCHVSGLGLLSTIERTPEQAWQVPNGPGAAAADGGEIWTEGSEASDGSDDPTLIFRHVSDTAITRIVADSAHVRETALVRRARSVAADWQPPPGPRN